MPDVHCAGCGRRLGKRSKTVLMLANCVLCNDQCADSVSVHQTLWWSCPHHHTPREHDGAVLTTIGRARQSLAYTNPD